MTGTRINRLIHEKMGLTYHVMGEPGQCSCGRPTFIGINEHETHCNYSFTNNWQDWGSILLPWCRHQEWWNEFTWRYSMSAGQLRNVLDHVEPRKFCWELVGFWREYGVIGPENSLKV